jgi:hypothetical protein
MATTTTTEETEDYEHHLCPSCGQLEGWLCGLGSFVSDQQEQTHTTWKCKSCGHSWVETKTVVGEELAQARKARENLNYEDCMTAVPTSEMIKQLEQTAEEHPSSSNRLLSAGLAAALRSKQR